MHTFMNTKRGIAPIAVAVLVLLAVGGGAFAVKKGVDKKQEKAVRAAAEAVVLTPPAASVRGAIHVKLDEQNKSGQKAEATLIAVGTSTVKVVLNVTGKPSTVPQPAHIHIGSCPSPGAVKYPLTSVDKGASQTEIPNLTLDELLTQGPLAINVHKSATEASVYVACGNIIDTTASTSMKNETKNESVKVKETKVIYNKSGFSPKTVTVKKGGAVVFENKTGAAASIASNPHPEHTLYPEFDQYKTDQRGKTEFTFIFDKVGTWSYHDHLNANVVGTVTVTE